MILGIVASGQMVGGGVTPPPGVDEPWGEFARQETITSGALTLSGLDLSGLVAVRLILAGITCTTDATTAMLRFHISGSEVATGYQWGIQRVNFGASATGVNGADTEIHLCGDGADSLGNASTEGLDGWVTVHGPASALYKRALVKTTWVRPNGVHMVAIYAAGQLDNTGPITGFTVFASSDLTAGSLILLGLE
jgi:hypothetical protein